MAISQPAKGKHFLSRLRTFLTLKDFNSSYSFPKRRCHTHFAADMCSPSVSSPGQVEFLKWRKLDSRKFGVRRSMISESSWIVLNVLQRAGYEAYLVGGCVRDLLLNKVPKDFDVITTAGLKQIRKSFHRAEIVGRRFPICIVRVKSAAVEVSSFETVSRHVKGKDETHASVPGSYGAKDLTLWRNCMHRDFTINSFFFDPFTNKIYDYVDAIKDLRSLVLRTITPAHLSFQEDCARILRGLRLAARLNLSFSKETETAIHNLSSSITSLDKTRLMLEVNYMLSYGAAEPSLLLLQKFKLLEILLPFQAAYLAKHLPRESGLRSMMLMKLFFNLDQLTSCDQPCNGSLWVALLAFHLALINNPQSPAVVLTFASVLYHGQWKEGVNFARQHIQATHVYVPEILDDFDFASDDELAERVTQFAVEVQNSRNFLVEKECLQVTMAGDPEFPASGLVFVSKKMGAFVGQIFDVLVKDIKSLIKNRKMKIDYKKFSEGSIREVRFVVGKIIMDTLLCGDIQGRAGERVNSSTLQAPDTAKKLVECTSMDLEKYHSLGNDDEYQRISESNNELLLDGARGKYISGEGCSISKERINKKRKTSSSNLPQEMADRNQDLIEDRNCIGLANKRQNVLHEGYDLKKSKKMEAPESPIDKKGIMTQNLKKLRQNKVTDRKQNTVAYNDHEHIEEHFELLDEVHDDVTKKQHMLVGSLSGGRAKPRPIEFQDQKYDLSHEVNAQGDKKYTFEKSKNKGGNPSLSGLFR